MFSATLYQNKKKEIKKKGTQNDDDDDTPMPRKNQMSFSPLNIIDFNEIADSDPISSDPMTTEQMMGMSIFAQMRNQDQQQQIQGQVIEEADSDSDESAPDSIKLQGNKPNIKRIPVVKDQDTINQISQEEPQAEPMSGFARGIVLSPNLNTNLIKQDDDVNSGSEYNVFSPGKSEQRESVVKQPDIEDKFSKLSQEAAMLERILPYYIINPYGQFRSLWSGLMILLLFYIVLILPIRLVFEEDTSKLLGLDITIDTIFFFDIVFTFFTAYEDERGIVIVEFKKIASNYLKGWFTMDLISTFPLYLVLDPSVFASASNVNSLLRLARLPRIYKLAAVLRVGNLIKHQAIQKLFFHLKLNKEYSLILKFIIITFIVIHLAGCLWYFVGSISDTENNWIIIHGLQYSSATEQYISSVYFVLTVLVTVGYGNIVPINNAEFIFTIIFEFIGVAFFAYVMGTLTFTFAKLSQKLTMIKEREIFFNELAHTYSLPKATHERLLMSIQSSIFSNSNQILEVYTEEEIFQELPPIVQGLLCEYLFKDIIDRIRFLQGKPRGFLRKLFMSMIPVFLNKGDAIFFKGEPADFVYFVIKGRLVTKCEDQNGKIRSLVHVEGSYFGEVDIIVQRARSESAIAESSSEVWKTSKEQFMKLLKEYEDIKMEVVDYAIKKEKSRKSTVKVVKNVQFLELLAKSKKEQVTITKSQFVQRVKDKMIGTLNDIVKNKGTNDKDLFTQINDLDSFLEKVSEYNKIKDKLQVSNEDLQLKCRNQNSTFCDQELEESLLKGLKIQTHISQIQEYL